jgi:hypothetical protein
MVAGSSRLVEVEQLLYDDAGHLSQPCVKHVTVL